MWEIVESVNLAALAIWSITELLEKAGRFQAHRNRTFEVKLGFQLVIVVIIGGLLAAAVYEFGFATLGVAVSIGLLFVVFLFVLSAAFWNNSFSTLPRLKRANVVLTLLSPIIFAIEVYSAIRHFSIIRQLCGT